VGVGQTELDIMELADTTVVTLVPESGDAVQTRKAGLMEAADVFVVNKADRAGAPGLMAELTFAAHLQYTGPTARQGIDWETSMLSAQAANDVGVVELLDAIRRHRAFLERSLCGSSAAAASVTRGPGSVVSCSWIAELRTAGPGPMLPDTTSGRRGDPMRGWLRLTAVLAWVMTIATRAHGYNGGPLRNATDLTPQCASCHSSVGKEQLRVELVENKHYKAIEDGAPGATRT
jgi:hypothetical protein